MPIDNRHVRGADKLARRLQTIKRNLGLAATVEEVGQLLLRRTQQRFDAEVDPDNRPWTPLKPQTIDRRRRGGYPPNILKRTGNLRKAITLIRGSVEGTIFTNTGAGIRIGVEDPEIAEYGRTHQRGMPSKGIPVRRFLGVGNLDVKAVDALMRRKARDIERLT